MKATDQPVKGQCDLLSGWKLTRQGFGLLFGTSADARGSMLALLGAVSADAFKDSRDSRTNAGIMTFWIIFLMKNRI